MLKKRAAHYAVLLCATVLIVFFFPRLMPGSPVTRLVGEEMVNMSPDQKEQLFAFYNLDKSLPEQFILFLKNTVTLDWGMSYSKKQPIQDLLKAAIPWTLLVAICNLVLSTLIGTFIGAASAFLRKKRKDIRLVLLLMLLGTLPSFWIGMILISVFSVQLGWFPLYGAYSQWGNYTGAAYFLDVLRHLALPIATTVIVSLSSLFTTSRYSVLNVLQQDYIQMAEARGLPDKRIKLFYVVRNALIPVFTVFMTHLGFILSGSVIVERLFSYPGIGLLLYEAISARDYPLMQYVFLITSVLVIVAAFLADVVNRKLDPSMEAAYEE